MRRRRLMKSCCSLEDLSSGLVAGSHYREFFGQNRLQARLVTCYFTTPIWFRAPKPPPIPKKKRVSSSKRAEIEDHKGEHITFMVNVKT